MPPREQMSFAGGFFKQMTVLQGEIGFDWVCFSPESPFSGQKTHKLGLFRIFRERIGEILNPKLEIRNKHQWRKPSLTG